MKMMLFFSIIVAVSVNAALKRKRKKKTLPTEVTKQNSTPKPKSDEIDKYFCEENSEQSPESLGHVKELPEGNHFVENRLLLPNPAIKSILEGLRPREVVILAQTCKTLLLKIISMDSYQYLRVEGLDHVIPQNISEKLKKREIRHHRNWNVIVFNPNTIQPKEQQASGDFLAVVNANVLKYFRLPKGSDLENDEIFLCELNEGISYIILGKVFSRSSAMKNGEILVDYEVLNGMPIQVSDDRKRQVVFFISKRTEGTYDLGALNASFNPQLQNVSSYNSLPDLASTRLLFNCNEVKSILVGRLKQ